MKTIFAIYKGDRVVELLNKVDWPQDTKVLVVIPDHEDERELHSQLQRIGMERNNLFSLMKECARWETRPLP
jgi:hypothetical protein